MDIVAKKQILPSDSVLSSEGADPISSPNKEAAFSECQTLAERLIEHMGIEKALEVSENNQWYGVSATLEQMKHRT